MLFIKPFPWYGVDPAVLSRLGCSILGTKSPQELTFVGIMSNTVDEAGFWFALRAIYISFTALASSPIRCGASIWRGGFSSIIPTESSTIGFCPISFLIRMCYHTFMNIFCDFHTLKHVSRFLKRDWLAIKALNIRLLRPAVMHTV